MAEEPEPPPQEAPPKETDMDIHKVKPIHSWRDFLKELGTIVLGICIALSAEQAVEWFHWRSQVQEARKVIATEMAQNLVSAVFRLRTQGCIERRLDALTDIVEAASRSGTLPPVGYIGQPPPRQWRSGSWESLVAAETATHFPRQELADLADLYQLVKRMEAMIQPDLQAWGYLYAMVGPGRPLDPGSQANLRQALSLVRAFNRSYASQSITLVARTRALGLPFGENDLKQIAEARHQPLTAMRASGAIPDMTSSICGPMGPVPARYGQSQFSLVPALSDRAARSLPDFGAP